MSFNKQNSAASLAPRLALGLSLLFSPVALSAQEANQIEAYHTTLGANDRVNSSGVALDSVCAVVHQDRANYHRFDKADAGDGNDETFTTAAARSVITGACDIATDDADSLAEKIRTGQDVEVSVTVFGEGDNVVRVFVREVDINPQDTEQVIAAYNTILGANDRVNSSGLGIDSVCAVVHQDRANHHRFDKADAGDGFDEIFQTAAARSVITEICDVATDDVASLSEKIRAGQNVHVSVTVYGTGYEPERLFVQEID